ncbi:MAG: carotenoid biosynthesis protein [bacterium]|nr:carotenoid biosynthesis protein [bacterium]
MNLLRLISTIDPLTGVTVAVWVLAMIAVPIQRWIGGDAALPLAISLGVILQIAASLTALARGTAPSRGWGIGRALLLLAVVAPTAWLIEWVGHTTDFPFGAYAYTDRLQPQAGGVPFLVPLAWLMMIPPAWAVAQTLVGHMPGVRGRAAFIGTAMLAFTAWDLFLDPQMVAWNLWVWDDPGTFNYFGIPWINYAGWLLAAGVITTLAMGVFALIGQDIRVLPLTPLLIIYAITWVLQSIGHWFFWGLPGSGTVGFIVMGAFTLAAARRWWIAASAAPPFAHTAHEPTP